MRHEKYPQHSSADSSFGHLADTPLLSSPPLVLSYDPQVLGPKILQYSLLLNPLAIKSSADNLLRPLLSKIPSPALILLFLASPSLLLYFSVFQIEINKHLHKKQFVFMLFSIKFASSLSIAMA